MTIRRLLFTLLLAASVATMSANGGAPAPDNKGTDFFLAFPQNVGVPPTPTHRMTLFLAADDATKVEISGPLVVTKTFDIPASSVLEVFFDTTSLQVSPGAVSDKGIRVRSIDPLNPSQEGAPIAVYGLNRRMGSAGAYTALPVDVLGMQYRALSRPGTSHVTIVGTQPNTTVTITQYATVLGVTTVSAPVNIPLNQLQTYLVQDPVADLTGTLVTANHPIAVYSGNQIGGVNGGSTDHMIEQLVPVSDWGSEFIVAPIEPNSSADVVRVLAHEDGTQVEVNGVAVLPTLAAGRFHEFTQAPTSGSWIQTSKPALVAHYNKGDALATDAFVMLVPPVEQFSRQYLFGTPLFPRPPLSPFIFSDRINIVVRDGDEAGLWLNGEPLSTTWTSVNGHRYARVAIDPGATHKLEHQEPTVRFGAWVYGQAMGEGYGYAAGQLVEDKTPPHISMPVDQTIEATGPEGATVTWGDPIATDFGRGEIEVSCTRESGSVFNLGKTVVECRATDPAGNKTTASFNVTVEDTTPPDLSVSDIEAHATGPNGAVVNYDKITAFDIVDLDKVTIDCQPPSGSRFPLGPGHLTAEPAIVTCTAADRSGNTTRSASTVLSVSTTPLPGTFTVTVTNDAPVCSAARPSMSTIPPWRRGFVPIIIKGVTDPDRDRIRIRIVSIFQDEPVSRRDDDDDDDKSWRQISFDGFGVGHRVAFVRAQRSPRGDGRVYHIRFVATDHIGASCSGEVTVGVPRHRHGAAVDGGALFDSTAGFRPPNPGHPNRDRRNDDEEENDD